MLSVEEYRQTLRMLTDAATTDLRVLLRQASDGTVAREILEAALPELVQTYGSAAGALSADWYDDLRAAESVPGRFRARVAPGAKREQVEATARWGIDPLFRAERDWDSALKLLAGGTQRHIVDYARETVRRASLDDPQAQGWKRMAGPGACAFCRMLADREPVWSKETVDFGAHNHCSCICVPEFGGDVIMVREYERGPRYGSRADYERARRWMAEHGY